MKVPHRNNCFEVSKGCGVNGVNNVSLALGLLTERNLCIICAWEANIQGRGGLAGCHILPGLKHLATPAASLSHKSNQEYPPHFIRPGVGI